LHRYATASPLSALLVFLAISGLPMLNHPMSVPLCLLLSGGTFLYAACIHVLPETVVWMGVCVCDVLSACSSAHCAV
jgi:hypothetical protein